MAETIRVGMTEIATAKSPDVLETQALGSCVSVALYDPVVKLGGLTHAMLPDTDSATKKSSTNIGKFVDSSIEELLRIMLAGGAVRTRIVAKIAGGSNMFPDITSNHSSIGDRNVETARKKLKDLRIRIVAEDVGGFSGRTVVFYPEDGSFRIKRLREGEKVI